jgi:hypothetical protein
LGGCPAARTDVPLEAEMSSNLDDHEGATPPGGGLGRGVKLGGAGLIGFLAES